MFDPFILIGSIADLGEAVERWWKGLSSRQRRWRIAMLLAVLVALLEGGIIAGLVLACIALISTNVAEFME